MQKREAERGAVHIELIDLDRFLALWLQHYEKIPEAKRAKFRLEPVYFLAPEMHKRRTQSSIQCGESATRRHVPRAAGTATVFFGSKVWSEFTQQQLHLYSANGCVF
jgi:hypothetical protein